MLTLIIICVAVCVAVRASRAASAAPHWKLWECIHSREAAWDDPNDPYFGGLQMGWWFMHHYGQKELDRWGTADHWPPVIQVWVAERAYKREGFSQKWLHGQWPRSSPPCAAYY